MLPAIMGCMYGWVVYVGHGVPGRTLEFAATAAFAADDGHGVAGRMPGVAAANCAVAAADHGVAVCAPALAAATAAAEAAAANPGGAV